MHSNLCVVLTPWNFFKQFLFSYFPSFIMPQEDSNLSYPLSKHLSFKMEESGYFHIQATKPDTVGRK